MLIQPDRRSVLVGVAGLGLTAVQAQASPAGSPLTRRLDRLFLAARVNAVDVEGLLDTAAETSLLSPAFAERLGLGSGAETDAHGSGAAVMTARLVEHVRIDAAGVGVPDATVAVIDLGDVSRRLAGRPIEMIVGREIFDAARLVIDIPALTIRRLAAGEAPGGAELPLTEDRGLMLLPVSIEGGELVNAEFDLGNGTGVIVSRRYAMRAGLFDGRALTTTLGGGLGGAKPRQGLILKTITIGGRRFHGVHADVDDAPDAHDANIGVGLLQHFRITTDFPGHKVWLASVQRPSPGVS